MSDWLDLSGRGTCFRKGDVDAVGGLVLLAWQVNAGTGPPEQLRWAWSAERVNRTGRSELRYGRADSPTEAKLLAEEAARSVLGLTQRTLFEEGEGDGNE